ncbi:MAG: hypothetical protein ACXW0Q_14790 [Methylovulum sp.]
MKNITIKKAILATSLLAASGLVAAHDLSGTLGDADLSTDYYAINCFDDGSGAADRLELQVIDLAPAPTPNPFISAQITKGLVAKNTTDLVDGDTAFSPKRTLIGGAGNYLVTVNKTRKGAESYSISYHCMTSSGAHTGTQLTTLQNQ